MFLVDNPVLQRELLSNLRAPRAFVRLLVYQLALASVIVLAYPRETRIDLTTESAAAQKLVDFFFIGQFAIASLMAPSFAAGAITGEKERKTYEMLLASPLNTGSIVFGKLTAALTHLVVLMISSLPIIRTPFCDFALWLHQRLLLLLLQENLFLAGRQLRHHTPTAYGWGVNMDGPLL